MHNVRENVELLKIKYFMQISSSVHRTTNRLSLRDSILNSCKNDVHFYEEMGKKSKPCLVARSNSPLTYLRASSLTVLCGAKQAMAQTLISTPL